jgi:sugar lactone lactonase YvrE
MRASNAIRIFGGDGLRRTYVAIAALIVLLWAPQVIGAGAISLKWVTSIYADSNGVGLERPEGVACGEKFVVVADTGNNRLVRYSYDDSTVTAEAEFQLGKSDPVLLQLSSKGDLYFLDGRERRIVVLKASGERIGFLNPKSMTSSKEIVPKSFRIDGDDNIYILDIFSQHVIILDSDWQFSKKIPLPESDGFFSDLALDGQGKIYVLDSVEAVVHSMAKGADTFTPFTGSMKEIVNFPARLSVDDRGILYLVDQNGSGLALVAPDGSLLGRRLGLGWKKSGLFYPSQICISAGGDVFIADRNNNRVQMFRVAAD